MRATESASSPVASGLRRVPYSLIYSLTHSRNNTRQLKFALVIICLCFTLTKWLGRERAGSLLHSQPASQKRLGNVTRWAFLTLWAQQLTQVAIWNNCRPLLLLLLLLIIMVLLAKWWQMIRRADRLFYVTNFCQFNRRACFCQICIMSERETSKLTTN